MIAPVGDPGDGGFMKPHYVRGSDELLQLLSKWGISHDAAARIESTLRTERIVSERTLVLRSAVNVNYRLRIKPMASAREGDQRGKVILLALPISDGENQWEREFSSIEDTLMMLQDKLALPLSQINGIRNSLSSGRETEIGGTPSGVSFSVPANQLIELGMLEKDSFSYRCRLPRFHELRDLVTAPNSPNAYFQRFEETLRVSSSAMRQFEDFEKEFGGLDDEAWNSLKAEAAHYLMARHAGGRGWQQLFDILNQARAYNYLVHIGCTSVRFISRAKKQGIETPDLEGVSGTGKVLCEVKTINISDQEIQARGTARYKSAELGKGFFSKLHLDIDKATKQLRAYDPVGDARHLLYFNICFDDSFAEYKEEYFNQIDEHLRLNPFSGIELVFHNDQTAFYKPLTMAAATVVN